MKIKNNWTEEQWEAINEKDCNLLVAAAAGAGKTAVLVERIMCKITDPENPTDIDRLLIMTFTNAAAAEMRDRISVAISDLLEKDSDNHRGDIQKQLTLLSKASITTIHSFCLEVVRSNFQRVDIDPGFKIMADTETVLMKIEVINELFDEKYENENQEFFELLDLYGGKSNDLSLQNIVLDLYDFIQKSPWPDKWFNEMTERLIFSEDSDFANSIWGKILVNSVVVQLTGMKEAMGKALAMIKSSYGLEKYESVFAEELSDLELLLAKCVKDGLKWDDIYRDFENQKFVRLPSAGKDSEKETQEAVKKIRNEVKTRIEKIKKNIFYSDSFEVIKDISVMYPAIKNLVDLVLNFSQRFSNKKSKKSVVDFNDLEHFCLEILTQKGEKGEIIPSAAAEGYRDRYIEVLVDEYQDSNLIQEAIIRMVSRIDRGTPNIFMVGDVKQSIYRFRQAKPELFLKKYRDYSGVKGSHYRKIVLLKNFRSRREIIDGINFVFKQIMSRGVGELDYNEAEYLNPGASFPENERKEIYVGGPVELHLIEINESSQDSLPRESEESDELPEAEEFEEESLDVIQAEARMVAERIKALLQRDDKKRTYSVYDRGLGVYRQAEYRDIVVLLRTVKKWSDIFSEEFELQKIPVFADIGTGFFKTPEVQVVLSLLQIIDNPIQDIPLLSVLRSPIVSFSTEEMADLRLVDKKANLYRALQLLAEEQVGETGAKSRLFLSALNRWREMSLYLPIDQLLWQIYSETGYMGIVGAMPGGQQRQANLNILFERARQYEEGSYRGLFNFINFVDKLKSNRGDMGSAKLLGENDNVVRIMSIHKSKGLEFPIVILSGTGKKINLQDMNKNILVHQELGIGPDIIDHKERIIYPSLFKQAIREKIKIETYSEELRILYVALTRAREKLIITGALKNVEDRAAKWLACGSVKALSLPEDEILKSGNYLDWLGIALIRHEEGGSVLRKYVSNAEGCSEYLLADASCWEIKLQGKSDIKKKRISNSEVDFSILLEKQKSADPGTHSVRLGEIDRKLSWKYPFQKGTLIPAKLSVTELKRYFELDLPQEGYLLPGQKMVKKPMFLEAKTGLSAAEAGTVMHFIMQHLDFSDVNIAGQINDMVNRDLITVQQAESVDLEKITGFINSPLGLRLAASGKVNREVPFNIEIPCYEIYPDMQESIYNGETILLQGVIDCYFEEPDGIVLIDYKTDYVADFMQGSLKEKFRVQIEYYAKALEMLSEKKVKEKYVYLFWNGQVLLY